MVTGKAGSPLVICSERRGFPFTSQGKEKALRYQQGGLRRKGRQRICVFRTSKGSLSGCCGLAGLLQLQEVIHVFHNLPL